MVSVEEGAGSGVGADGGSPEGDRSQRRRRGGWVGVTPGALTPELAELIKRTFRGVHLLAWLKRKKLDRAGNEEDFRRAAEAAKLRRRRPSDRTDRTPVRSPQPASEFVTNDRVSLYPFL